MATPSRFGSATNGSTDTRSLTAGSSTLAGWPGGGGGGPNLPVKFSPYQEIGHTGLITYGGIVQDEFLRQLQGDRARRVWREMADNDPVVGGLIFAIIMLVRQTEWRVEPAVAKPKPQPSLEAQAAQRQLQLAGAGNPAAISSAQTKDKADLASHQARLGMQTTEHQTNLQSSQQQALADQKANLDLKTKTGLAEHAHQLGLDQMNQQSKLTSANDQAKLQLQAKLVSQKSGLVPGSAARGGAGAGKGVSPSAGNAPAAAKVRKAFSLSGAIADRLRDSIADDIARDRITKAAAGGGSGSGSTIESGPVDETAGIDPDVDIDPMYYEAADKVARFVDSCLYDMSMTWPDTLSAIMTMLVFGFTYTELIYKKRMGPKEDGNTSKYDDGLVGWRKWAMRAQETRLRWEFDSDGGILGMWQLVVGHPVSYIPIQKALLFRTETGKNNPEGRSMLRNAYRAWYFKKRIEEIEAIGIERDLAGLPVAWVPPQMLSPSATEQEQKSLDQIKLIVRNIKRDEQEGVVFPLAYDPESKNKLYDLTLLSTGGQRQFDTDKIVTRYDQRILMTAMADFMLLGHGSSGRGSFALGSSKVDVFTAAIEAWVDQIAAVANSYAIPRLLKLNGVDPMLTPKLSHGKVEKVDLAELGSFISALAAAGAPMFPDDDLENYAREVAGFPLKPELDDEAMV